MGIYCYEIPVPNYEGTDTLSIDLYFEGDHCPNLDEVKAAVYKKLKADDALIGEEENTTSVYHAVLKTLESVTFREWPHVGGNHVQSSEAIHVPVFGRRSIIARCIKPFPI